MSTMGKLIRALPTYTDEQLARIDAEIKGERARRATIKRSLSISEMTTPQQTLRDWMAQKPQREPAVGFFLPEKAQAAEGPNQPIRLGGTG